MRWTSQESKRSPGNFNPTLIRTRRVYHSSLPPEQLEERLQAEVTPVDSRGFFSHWTGAEPEKPYLGKVEALKARLMRLPSGGKRLFQVDVRLKWQPEGQGAKIILVQRTFLWLWIVGILGFFVAAMSALGEVIDQNWGEAAFWVGIFFGIYYLHYIAFCQVAKINEAFLHQLWELKPTAKPTKEPD